MLQWPIPKNITELRGFLGLTGYYGHFVRNYGQIARPLIELLKKGGPEFVIKTNQQSLRHLLEQKAVSSVQQRWAAKLIGLNYRIEYKPGVENRVADALSRRHVPEELNQITLTAPLNMDKEELLKEVKADTELGPILAALEGKFVVHPGYTLERGMLYRNGCLVVPTGSPFIPKLLEQFHASTIGGHEGALQTFKRLT
ncbi:PREDICTED: uncharacterized protein LOC104772860 [Camelina sativa]|uniref:Uncharacterized protein LOC104772860 n=1 Tax=Camelina sativa TaxID=90675 RepID=A0ABM0Y585_CAMSA|nr:PREDICTED: uncharacterized protein LOC104772860 [Camelina sativa]